ncbi:MAG TPA: phosphomannomutase/phosphoglucomutase [Thermomicrobiales bacterium]|nr:phosphomannomutase/phosphoglucomutase [Thermomicrobiales bacterium]
MSSSQDDLSPGDRQRAASLFKAYDVRGIVPDELTPALAGEIGRAIVEVIGPDTVVVGRDMRVSSPLLASALIEGIRDAGADVVDIGMVSTDALSFAVGRFGYPAGVMVTASHNPPEYNGFKISREEARALSLDEGLDEIRDHVVSGDLPPVKPAIERGSLVERDILDDYAAHMLSLIDRSVVRPLRIAIDAGNGMAGITVPRVFRDLPIEVTPMYFEPDGTFPNHPANPIEPENIAELRRTVVENGYDLGAAFDGDADRVFLVDEKGDAIGGDILTSMVASRMLERNPGAAIVYNLISSRGVPETIAAKGGRPIRSRVGHSYIKETMRDEDAVFGGEHSGHFYFRDNWYADSGMAALLFALEMVSEAGKPLSEVIAPLDHRFRSGEINSEVADAATVMRAIEEHYRLEGAEIDHLDGVTVSFPSWWFNVRASNTQPLLRLNVEADDRSTLEAKTTEVLTMIRGATAGER